MAAEAALARDTSAPQPGRTTAHLLAFLDYARRTGLLTDASATTYRQCALRILSAQPEPESTDLIALDTELAIAQFTVAHPDLSDASRKQYASGFRKAQHLLRDYHINPARWHEKAAHTEHGWLEGADGALELRIPLTRNREIHLTLPPDFNAADMRLARRVLNAYLRGLIPAETGETED